MKEKVQWVCVCELGRCSTTLKSTPLACIYNPHPDLPGNWRSPEFQRKLDSRAKARDSRSAAGRSKR